MDELIQLALKSGFTAAAPLPINALELKEEVRKMCEVNTCGRYNKSWSCPPGCGDLDTLQKRFQSYQKGILVQTTGTLEDSFDIEGIQDLSRRHKENLDRLTPLLRSRFPKLLPMGAGSCTLCKECTYPDAPCRFPDQASSSMEAYGLVVSEVCQKCNLPYYYGKDTLTYVACYLLG